MEHVIHSLIHKKISAAAAFIGLVHNLPALIMTMNFMFLSSYSYRM